MAEVISRERLAELLNEDLSREYQAIISYVVYSQVLKGAEYMSIADGAVAELVGIECGVVSGVINLESSSVEALDWRPRHDEHYYEA